MAQDPASSPPPSSSETETTQKAESGAAQNDSEELKGYKLLVKLLKHTRSGQTDYDALLADLDEPNLKKNTLQKRVSRCLIRLNLSREEVGLSPPRAGTAAKAEKVVENPKSGGEKKGKSERPAKKRKREERREAEPEAGVDSVGWMKEEDEDY